MKRIAIFLINVYKRTLSPILRFSGFNCKFHPTCSEYAKEAILKYGVLKGSVLGLLRILKCNPFSKGRV